MTVEMDSVVKRFGDRAVLSNIHLSIQKGEFVAIYGAIVHSNFAHSSSLEHSGNCARISALVLSIASYSSESSANYS